MIKHSGSPSSTETTLGVSHRGGVLEIGEGQRTIKGQPIQTIPD